MLAARRALAAPKTAGPPVTAHLLAWYDATQITGLADGAALATWPDESNHFDLGFSFGNYYKTTAANLIGGKPTVALNPGFGSTNTFSSQTVPLILFVVAKLKSTGNGLGCLIGDHQSGYQGLALWMPYNANNYGLSANNPAIVGGTVDLNAHQITAIVNGAGSAIHLDGAVIASGDAGSGPTGSGLEVGIDVTSTDNFWGLVGEILIYNSVLLTGPQISSIEAYLKTKWSTP